MPGEQIERRWEESIGCVRVANNEIHRSQSVEAVDRNCGQTQSSMVVLGHPKKVSVHALILLGSICGFRTAAVIRFRADMIRSRVLFAGTNNCAQHTCHEDHHQ